MQYAFPVVVMAAQVGAAVVYAVGDDWRKAVFWAAAAAMNAVVTF